MSGRTASRPAPAALAASPARHPPPAARAAAAASPLSARASLRAAVRDAYRHSWRLLLLNSGFSAATLAILLAASYAQPALVLALLIGPMAAALMHCAVVLAQTQELRLGCALTGLRLHWRRGLELAMLTGGALLLAGIATSFYARAGTAAWPLAILSLYLLVLFGVLQLLLWPLAIAHPNTPLRSLVRTAGVAVLARPFPSLGLALALLAVNVLGAAAILPLLTLTVAYSFLAAAHFALPRRRISEG